MSRSWFDFTKVQGGDGLRSDSGLSRDALADSPCMLCFLPSRGKNFISTPSINRFLQNQVRDQNLGPDRSADHNSYSSCGTLRFSVGHPQRCTMRTSMNASEIKGEERQIRWESFRCDRTTMRDLSIEVKSQGERYEWCVRR